MMQVSVPAVEVAFVLKTAVSLAAIPVTDGSPDLILLHTDEESVLTAVSSQFPHIPIILIADDDDRLLPQTAVMDVLPRLQLTAPLLKRVLRYAMEKQQHAYIRNKVHAQQQIAEALLQVGVAMNATLDYDLLLDNILHYVADFFPYDLASIMRNKDAAAYVERIRTADKDTSFIWSVSKAARTIFPLAETRNIREVVENGRYLVIPDVAAYPDWNHVSDEFRVRSWLGAPLLIHGQVIGLLSIDSLRPNVYDEKDGRLLMAFATQAALALHNARSYQERQREIAELSALHMLSQLSTEAVTVDELLTQCTQIVADKLYPDSFGFILVNDDGLTMSAHHAFHTRLPIIHPEKRPLGTGIVGQVIQTGQLRRISDVHAAEDYEGIIVHSHSELCVPLKVGAQIIGAINAESILFDAFTAADERFLVTLSQQLTTAIERMQLLEAERKNQIEVNKLHEAAAFLTTSLDLEQVFTHVLNGLQTIVPHDNASITLLYEEELRIMAVRGAQELQRFIGFRFHTADSLFAEIAQTKRPLYLPDAPEDPRFLKLEANCHIRSWLGLPLIVRDQVLGVLTIDSQQRDSYGKTEMQLAQSFANHAAIAIDNARLYTVEQQARKQAEIMQEASTMMVQTLDRDTILEILLNYLQKLVSFDSANVLFIDGDFAHIYLSKDLENWIDAQAMKQQVRINVQTNSTIQEIARTQKGLLISDVRNDSRWETFAATHYIRSWIGVPIIIAGGELLGYFSIEKTVPDYFNKEHLNLVETFTSQAAILLQNAQFFQETQQRAVELEQITTLSAALRETVELNRLLDLVLEYVLKLVNGSISGIYLIDSESGDLVLRAVSPPMPQVLGWRQTVEQGIVGFVARTGRVYISPDFQRDPLLEVLPEEAEVLSTIQSAINLPLRVQERVVGVFNVSLDRLHDFSDREVKLLTAVSEIAGTAIDRAIVLDTLEQRISLRTQELAQANERLTELDRLKTKFVSDVSHELRTPITNLSLYLDLLVRGKAERHDQYVAVLRQQIDRLTIIIEDILSISRLDMGKIKLTILPVDVNRVVQQVAVQFESQLDENVSLFTDYQQEMPFILGDETLIAQMVTILLHNAVAYTPTGSIHIMTLWQKEQKRVCIEIKDTGIGIPRQELEHLFVRFYRASNVSQSTIPGTGLGLSLVKELLDLHHGTIELSSEVNSGTVVTLSLPHTPRLPAAG